MGDKFCLSLTIASTLINLLDLSLKFLTSSDDEIVTMIRQLLFQWI